MSTLEEPTGEQLVQNLAYLKGARQDPQPWEDQGGVPTGPMVALTPSLLEALDQEQASAVPSPQRPVQRLTRMQERQRRKTWRRQFALGLGLAAAAVFLSAFLFAAVFF